MHVNNPYICFEKLPTGSIVLISVIQKKIKPNFRKVLKT